MGIGIKRSETGGSGVGAAKVMSESLSVFDDFNKADGSPGTGDIGEHEPYLSLELSDSELLSLAKKWTTDYQGYEGQVKNRQKRNEQYWLGKQYGYDTGDYRSVDNVIFESLETLLPIISRQNPTPYVESADSRNAENTARIIEKVADKEVLKLKIKKGVRHWSLYFIGSLKAVWDEKEDDVAYEIVLPENLILDKDGYFEGGEFKGRYIGERKQKEAKELAEMFPKKKALIKELVGDSMGTKLKYVEWWTDEYVFWTLPGHILDKRKNPHWNYDETKIRMDEFGEEYKETVTGKNHFKYPRKPYSFISVFNLGRHPHDDTTLVEQSIPLQDSVNKRDRQIDKNADDANSGWVFNNQFSENDAKSALRSLRRGGGIIAPTASINESVTRLNSPSLPNYVLNDKLDKRNQIQSIMGTRGSSAGGIMNEKTVQGKIEIRQSDADRITLIIEHVEQMVDFLYNYTVQMVYVYYTDENVIEKLGDEVALEYIQFLQNPLASSLIVSIKEGSLVPQDPLLKRNEAVELYSMNALDPLTMYERMNFANPEETVKRLIQYNTDPNLLIQEEGVSPTQSLSEEQLPQGMPQGIPQTPPQQMPAPPIQPPNPLQDLTNLLK